MNSNKVKIYIDDFGPIKGHFEIEVKPFMVFSGESGLGKSYTALLTHYVYRVICGEELHSFFSSLNVDYDDLKPEQSEGEILLFQFVRHDFCEWVDRSALEYMRNVLGNPNFKAQIHIDFAGIDEKLKFYFSRNIIQAQSDIIDYYDRVKLINEDYSLRLPKESGKWYNIPFVVLFSQYLREKFEITPSYTFFMPPSRGALVALPDAERLNLQRSMGMYQEFLNGLSVLKSMTQGTDLGYIRTLTHSVLHGEIKIKDSEMVYVMPDGEIPITAAAASVKELAPFSLMIQKGVLGRYSILFEEPESHLHPEMQIQVADLLAWALSLHSHIQITSHSDYVLRRLNDLIRLNILKQRMNDDERFRKYCSEHGFDASITIDPSIVGAYFFENNADNHVRIVRQDVSRGIPFDTFKEILNSQLGNSANLYDTVEEFL